MSTSEGGQMFKFKTKIWVNDNDYTLDELLSYSQRRKIIHKIRHFLKKEGTDLSEYINDGKIPLKSMQMEVGEDGYLYISVQSNRKLMEKDVEEIKENIIGQFSDGWGENGHEIDDDMTIIYMDLDVQRV